MLRMTAIPFGVSFLSGAALLVLAACGVVPSARLYCRRFVMDRDRNGDIYHGGSRLRAVGTGI